MERTIHWRSSNAKVLLLACSASVIRVSRIGEGIINVSLLLLIRRGGGGQGPCQSRPSVPWPSGYLLRLLPPTNTTLPGPPLHHRSFRTFTFCCKIGKQYYPSCCVVLASWCGQSSSPLGGFLAHPTWFSGLVLDVCCSTTSGAEPSVSRSCSVSSSYPVILFSWRSRERSERILQALIRFQIDLQHDLFGVRLLF